MVVHAFLITQGHGKCWDGTKWPRWGWKWTTLVYIFRESQSNDLGVFYRPSDDCSLLLLHLRVELYLYSLFLNNKLWFSSVGPELC